jgi:hypothetical protein
MLSVPIPEKVDIDAIIKRDAEAFSNALRIAVNKEAGWESSLDYVKAAVITTSPWMREVLKKLGIVPCNPEMLAEIAKQEGATFWKAAKNAVDGGADNKIAAEYVRRTISSLTLTQNTTPVQAEQAKTTAGMEDEPPNYEEDHGPHETQSQEQGGPAREYKSVHTYGSKAALCFSASTTRGDDVQHTVSIDGAMSSGVRVYDWKNKIIFQLTVQEIPLVIGVLHGFIDKLELKGHGRENEKALVIENQGNKYFISLLCKGEAPRGVPVPAKDIYPIITLLLRQALRNDPFLDTNYIIKLSERICRMHGTANQALRQQG